MLPLSFSEFLYFHDFEIKETNSALGGTRRQLFDKKGERYDLREAFDAYMRFGGMPGIADIGHTLMNEGLLAGGNRKGTPSAHTVQAYIDALLESYFFYEIKRFDIKGKEYLRTLGKYYLVDIGLRNYLLGFRNRDSGHAIENVVYFELLRRGYDVAIGKIGNQEVDFVATIADEKLYLQVTESMRSEDVRRRELSPLQKIRDNYEKIVLSLEPGLDPSYEGIKSLNLLDWLLDG